MNLCAICDEYRDQHFDFPLSQMNIKEKTMEIGGPHYSYKDRIHNLDDGSSRIPLNIDSGNNKFNNKDILNETNININDKEANTLSKSNLFNKNISGKQVSSNNHNSRDLINEKNSINNKRMIIDFELAKEVISELENPNLCEICFYSDTLIDPAVKFPCGHIFCMNCVKTYLEKNIQIGKVNIDLSRF